MLGKTVCYMHGGASPVGVASATFVSGRYSKHLPTRLLAAYEESQRDPNLLALSQEIALLDSHLADLIGKVGTGESGAVWRKLGDTYAAYGQALALGDEAAARMHLDAIGQLITRGLGEHAIWVDIRTSLEQRRKLVESERKRRVEMHTMVTADQAAGLTRALVAAVRDHVHDPETLRKIVADLDRLALPNV